MNGEDPERASSRQRAFDAMARELGFELEHASFETGPRSDVGIILGFIMSPVAEFADVAEGPDSSSADDADIEQVVDGWERLEPRDVKQSFSQFAHDPHIAVSPEGIGHVVEGAIENQEEFDAHADAHMLKSPREVTLTNFQVVHLGGQRAIATYTISENLTDGTVDVANSFAVVCRFTQGWRIIVANDRGCTMDH